MTGRPPLFAKAAKKSLRYLVDGFGIGLQL